MANLSTPLVDAVGGKSAKALGGLLKIERATVDLMFEGNSVEKFHGDEWLSVLIADLINRADVWMI